ncbi:MAG: hypothetical protein H6983_04515 [Ectothiorhodospiraceae bacterium]|nr:hypothetical protein [Ectothiorhodospiraceae bacterium]
MLASQLMLAPIAWFCVWLYLRTAPSAAPEGPRRRFDMLVVTTAFVVCALALAWVAQVDSGANDRIWRPVLSTLTSFFLFPAVIALGAWVRARRFGRR